MTLPGGVTPELPVTGVTWPLVTTDTGPGLGAADRNGEGRPPTRVPGAKLPTWAPLSNKSFDE